MRAQGEINPQETLPLLGADSFGLDVRWQKDLAFKLAVVNFHYQHLQRFVCCLLRFWWVALSTDSQALGSDLQVNPIFVHSGQVDADGHTFGTTVHIDRRLP